MLDARSQHIARAPHNSVHCVTLLQEQLGQVGAVLTMIPVINAILSESFIQQRESSLNFTAEFLLQFGK